MRWDQYEVAMYNLFACLLACLKRKAVTFKAGMGNVGPLDALDYNLHN